MSMHAIRSAFAFLTVLPVGEKTGVPAERLGRAFFPAVGAAVGLAAGGVFFAISVVAHPLLAAVAAVAALVILTGGLHLDGLVDATDGLFGGADREHRLAIMRDPRAGTFGVVAVVLLLLGEVAALSGLSPARGVVALLTAGTLSRWSVLGLVVALPYARLDGLGRASAGGHRVLDLAVGTTLALVVFALDWKRAAVAVPLVLVSSLGIGLLARSRIGGATGDVYGAAAEVGQLAVLLAFAVQP